MALVPFRTVLRSLGRSPGWALLAVVTLGVGIGATAAIWSVVDAVLLSPLPYEEPERLVAVSHTAPGLDLDDFGLSDGTYLLYHRDARTLASVGIWAGASVNLAAGPEPERVEGAVVTASLFPTLGVEPALGRGLEEADERPGAEPVVLLSHGLFRGLFGGDRAAVGETIRIDGLPYRVVGVMPEGFVYPDPAARLWLPLTIDPANAQPGAFRYTAVGRLAPGATPERAAEELTRLLARLPGMFPGPAALPADFITRAKMSSVVQPLSAAVVGDVERRLWLLLGAVGVVLLVACANVANLVLVRAEGRQREIAVRTALGATRGDVFRAFLGESLVLATAGGVLGFALAGGAVRLLVALGPDNLPRLHEIRLDGAVLGFTAALALAAGLAFGAVAALRYGAPELSSTLKEGGRGGTVGRGRHLARHLLVGAQVALALVLLVASGLMVRSFWGLRSLDPGFDPTGVLTLRLSLPDADYPDTDSTSRFVQQLVDRVAALPGVTRAGVVSELPLGGTGSNSGHRFEDVPQAPGELPFLVGLRVTSPGYFQALGIPLLTGRDFDRADHEQRTGVVIVSRALADRFWPGEDPIGRRLSPGRAPEGQEQLWYTVVGVVGSIRDQALELPPHQTVYYPLAGYRAREGEREIEARAYNLVVRAEVPPLSLADPVRKAVRELDPTLPIADVRTMEEVVADSTTATSFTMLLLVLAGAVALLLGAVGLYGVISYVVSQRTREIGVRMALGAARGDVARLVLRQGLTVAGLGAVVGLAAALAVTRLLRSLLFEVSPTDPATFAVTPALLLAIAGLAAWAPASRAASVDPIEALKEE